MDLRLLETEFERCRPWIEAALPYCYGTFDIEDVRNACMSGAMQLWPGKTAALVSEISRYPRRTGCHVAFAGGEFAEIQRLQEELKIWAKSVGCDMVTVSGRPGWVKKLGIGVIVSTVAMLEL